MFCSVKDFWQAILMRPGKLHLFSMLRTFSDIQNMQHYTRHWKVQIPNDQAVVVNAWYDGGMIKCGRCWPVHTRGCLDGTNVYLEWEERVSGHHSSSEAHSWTTSPQSYRSSNHSLGRSKCCSPELPRCWNHEGTQTFFPSLQTLGASYDPWHWRRPLWSRLTFCCSFTMFLAFFLRDYTYWVVCRMR